jgi:thiamine biosynthesis lipoprotein
MKTLAAGALLAALALQPATTPQPVTREAFLMGTRATLVTWDDVRSRGVARLERLLQPLERTEHLLSTWRDASEVTRLNASAGGPAVALSAALCAQFRTIDDVVRVTNGAFDPAIGALTAAWDIHGEGRVPSARALATALRRSGWRRIRFDARACTATLPHHLSLDVGGFGKGEAIDRAREATEEDPAAWLIDLGGQLGVKGSPPGRDGWDVSIAHPLRRSTAAMPLSVASGSLATSAGSQRDLRVNGRRVGHVLDPRTGRPAPFTGSVTVWHERGLLADALSTALYVMGPEAGTRWADARGIAACYLIPNGATVVRRPSRAFVARFGID